MRKLKFVFEEFGLGGRVLPKVSDGITDSEGVGAEVGFPVRDPEHRPIISIPEFDVVEGFGGVQQGGDGVGGALELTAVTADGLELRLEVIGDVEDKAGSEAVSHLVVENLSGLEARMIWGALEVLNVAEEQGPGDESVGSAMVGVAGLTPREQDNFGAETT